MTLKSATSPNDKTCNYGNQKAESQSKATVILSDNDETDDDFDSATDVFRANSSSHQLDVSASSDKKASIKEPASDHGSDSEQHRKLTLFAATSPRNDNSPSSASNRQSSVSVTPLQWSASKTQNTGTTLFITNR